MRNSKPVPLIAAASVLILFLGFGAAAARGISDKKFVEKAATGE